MKKKIILIIIITFFTLLLVIIFYKQENLTFLNHIEETKKLAVQKETNWQWADKQKKLYELAPTEVDLLLKELSQRFPEKDERIKAIAILRLGTPYQLGCLGEESGRDEDPIFRLDVADCTVFVLTTAALLHSQDLEQATEMMKFLNYRLEKETTYENRLHFTTDRNMVSPYFRDLTEEIVGKEKIIAKKVILNKTKIDGKRWIDIDWDKEIIIKYLPNEYITKEFLMGLPKSVGVAFIKEKYFDSGLDVVHEGLLFDKELLIVASSMQKKVVAEDFYDYYFGENGSTPRFDGIVLFGLTLNL